MDNPEAALLLIAILSCIFCSGFFVLAETAINESRKSHLEKEADDGNSLAAKALKILETPGKMLSVVQIGITLTSIILGIITGALAAPFLAKMLSFLPYAMPLSLIISVFFITYITLLFGEFLPKALAWQSPEKFLLKTVFILDSLEHISRPFVAFLASSANLLLSLANISATKKESITEDEVKDLIEQGTEEGTFEKTEQTMVDHIFHMSDQTAYSLMTPRTQMQWLDTSDPLPVNLKCIRESSQTVFPVAESNLDNFRGVIYTKDILDAFLEGKVIKLEAFIKKPVFVPRSMETFRVMEEFKYKGIHEAIVLDEYGGVVGFLTLSDIMEEIIGDAPTTDEPDPADYITPRDDNSWLVNGLYSVDDFKEKFAIDGELPDENHDHYHTMGGFLTAYFGYLPSEGETCQWQDFTFTISKMERARIAEIILTLNNKNHE